MLSGQAECTPIPTDSRSLHFPSTNLLGPDLNDTELAYIALSPLVAYMVNCEGNFFFYHAEGFVSGEEGESERTCLLPAPLIHFPVLLHQQIVKFSFQAFHFEGPTFLTLLKSFQAFVALTLAVITSDSFDYFDYFTSTLATL